MEGTPPLTPVGTPTMTPADEPMTPPPFSLSGSEDDERENLPAFESKKRVSWSDLESSFATKSVQQSPVVQAGASPPTALNDTTDPSPGAGREKNGWIDGWMDGWLEAQRSQRENDEKTAKGIDLLAQEKERGEELHWREILLNSFEGADGNQGNADEGKSKAANDSRAAQPRADVAGSPATVFPRTLPSDVAREEMAVARGEGKPEGTIARDGGKEKITALQGSGGNGMPRVLTRVTAAGEQESKETEEMKLRKDNQKLFRDNQMLFAANRKMHETNRRLVEESDQRAQQERETKSNSSGPLDSLKSQKPGLAPNEVQVKPTSRADSNTEHKFDSQQETPYPDARRPGSDRLEQSAERATPIRAREDAESSGNWDVYGRVNASGGPLRGASGALNERGGGGGSGVRGGEEAMLRMVREVDGMVSAWERNLATRVLRVSLQTYPPT
eukprot:2706610-Rhodomonas_salina.3